jgi:hypothetical protein
MIVLVTSEIVFSGQVIQTQESDTGDGIEADLTGINIGDNIITIKVKLRNIGAEEQG